jgi:hypothetical protein
LKYSKWFDAIISDPEEIGWKGPKGYM